MKRLGAALATVAAMSSVALANEPQEMTFEILKHNCSEYSAINVYFCEGYLMGVLGQLMDDKNCNIKFEMLEPHSSLNDLGFMVLKSSVRNADIYDYPKEARLAVTKIVRKQLCSN